MVENRAAADGAEHLIEVGTFESYQAMALAAYVHMNGPPAEGKGPTRADIRAMADAIERVTHDETAVFRGISETGEAHSFFVDLDPSRHGK